LAPLPLNLLDLDPERRELFQRWGLRTLGDLAELPAVGLAERLGPEGPRLQRLARGEDETPLVPTPLPETFELALDLEWPVDGLQPLSFLFARLLDSLCSELHARGRCAAALVLDLRLVNGASYKRCVKSAVPAAEARTWRTLLLLDLEAHPPPDAIQRITVRAEPTGVRSVQFSLLEPSCPSPERLAETMGRLQRWTAAGRAGAALLLDTHRPEAFAMSSFAPGSLRGEDQAVWPKPKDLKLKTSPRLALRLFRPPLKAQVTIRDGAPFFVATTWLRGAVSDRAGPWRASGDWWDAAWSREEWDVALSGGVYRIFRDRICDVWFLEGEWD